MTGYSFDHLLRLSNGIGTFEHAEYSTPRREHGFCTDDMARVLVVTSRELHPTHAIVGLAQTAFRFLADAQTTIGTIRNRRSASGTWEDEPATNDAWGRSLWGFGTAASETADRSIRENAMTLFDRGARQRSIWPRSMAFAALGAAMVLEIQPGHRPARELLADAAVAIGPPGRGPSWPWPEPRLTYANAAVAEAVIAAGQFLDRADLLYDGLRMLRWLLTRETRGDHLSPTPVGGAGPSDRPPAFDQQPLEVAALADACHRAALATGDDVWLPGVQMGACWFEGNNDVGVTMWDPTTGGGYDGLHEGGPNLNQGAESTLALLSTLQLARKLTGVVP